MTQKMFFLLLTCLFSFSVFSQGLFNINGKLIDANNQEAIAYATVVVKNIDGQLVKGGLSKNDGSFEISKVKPGKYLLEINYLGYQTKRDTLMIENQNINLGNIALLPNVKELGAVEVVAEKEQMEFNLDKKTFNVDKNILSEGGSAVDVLKQMPSINFDSDGKMTLRGSENFAIYINGRPSGITSQNREQILEQLPANSIQKIELITNPAANFDAEGMAGILNIITFNDLKPDSNSGGLNISAGTRNKYNIAANWLYKKGRWSLSNNLSYRYEERFNNGFNLRENYPLNAPTYSINQYSDGNNINNSVTFSGNVDYNLNKKNVVGINYLASFGRKNNPKLLEYQFLDANNNLYKLFKRHTDETSDNFNSDVGAFWNHKFANPKQNLSVLSSFAINNKEGTALYTQQNYLLTGTPDGSNPFIDRNFTKNKSFVSTNQVDLNLPFDNNTEFKTGAKVIVRNLNNDFLADSLNLNTNTYDLNTALTNRIDYKENVNAAYAMYAFEWQTLNIQTGLRTENTNITITNQLQKDALRKNSYTNVFPSLHVSKKLPQKQELQVSYSRRINRPNMMQLNPFANYSDPLNIMLGNPYLKPELIDNYEIGYLKYFDKHTINATLYFRQINHAIQRFRTIDSMGVSTVQFQNFDKTKNIGLELTARNSLFKWWNINTNFNLFQTQISGSAQQNNLKNTGIVYFARSTSNFILSRKTTAQLSVFYSSPMAILQGKIREMWSIDIAAKHEIIKSKLTVTLNVSDVIDTRVFRIYTSDYNFKGSARRKMETQIATISLVYKFGQTDKSGKNKPQDKDKQDRDTNDMDMGF